ncbi:MAG: LamG domain-containing protein, partial [Phycisphaerae bacterium]
PLILGRLRADPKPQLHTALVQSLAKLVLQTAPPELREAHSMALAAAAPRRVEWLDYFAAVLAQRCSGSGEKLDELLSLPGAYEKLRAAAEAAEESRDPEVASGSHAYVAAFNLVVGYTDCLLWLRSDVGVKLNADGRVVEWQDQSARKNHARQDEAGKWPRIEPPGADGRRFVKFDGADDHLDLPAGFADFSRGVTVTVWARPASRKRWARFVDLGNGQGLDNVIFSRSEASDDLGFQVYAGGKMGKAIAPKVIESGKWQHLAAAQDDSGRVVFYKNGQKVGEAKVPVAAGAVVRKLNYIARSSRSGDEYYEGLMDDIRIFNRGLTAREVKLICERTRGRLSGE